MVTQVAPVAPQKSAGVAFLLTFFFGPLGMFYSTVPGAIIMLVISFFAALLTFGLSIVITWPICIIWGVAAVSSQNAQAVAVSHTAVVASSHTTPAAAPPPPQLPSQPAQHAPQPPQSAPRWDTPALPRPTPPPVTPQPPSSGPIRVDLSDLTDD
jgi:hypothetical protein